jgi:hypothetical protein
VSKKKDGLAIPGGFIIMFLLVGCNSNPAQITVMSTIESLMPTSTKTLPSSLVYTPTEITIDTQSPYSTKTPIQSSLLKGAWHKYTTADGACTDSPVFIGAGFIGMGTTTFCSFSDERWGSSTVPQGTRATAANVFPPGGGWEVATDVGVCYRAVDEWGCTTQPEDFPNGFPYETVRGLKPLGEQPVYMLKDVVIFRKTIYNIPEIVGEADAIPTGIAISSWIYAEGYLPPEIWVGTNEYGIVVIQPDTGNITRYTTDDGLPSNTIRDISTEDCPKNCDFRDVWVATDQGMAHWDNSKWETYTTESGLPSNDVRGVASRQRNTVWAATAGGAAYFDGDDWIIYTHDSGLPEGDITGVIVRNKDIEFSTLSSGLLVFTVQNT